LQASLQDRIYKNCVGFIYFVHLGGYMAGIKPILPGEILEEEFPIAGENASLPD
jgi:hypothetical protein